MLLRPGADARPEVYLTRRHSRSRFMPDAFVFPGGAVDAADRAVATARVRGSAGAAAPELVVAAIRETFEEAGVLLASDAAGAPALLSADVLNAARAALHEGAAFEAFLAEHDLSLDARRLAYYSNWITPAVEPIRFDAHFFMSKTPPEQIAVADAMEVHDGVWMTPADALARGAAGEMTIRFPTQKHLERLARFASVDEALRVARERRVEPVSPAHVAGEEFLLDDDAW